MANSQTYLFTALLIICAWTNGSEFDPGELDMVESSLQVSNEVFVKFHRLENKLKELYLEIREIRLGMVEERLKNKDQQKRNNGASSGEDENGPDKPSLVGETIMVVSESDDQSDKVTIDLESKLNATQIDLESQELVKLLKRQVKYDQPECPKVDQNQSSDQLDEAAKMVVQRILSYVQETKENPNALKNIWNKMVKLGTLMQIQDRDKLYDSVFRNIIYKIYDQTPQFTTLELIKHALPKISKQMGARYMAHFLRFGFQEGDEAIRLHYYLNYFVENDLERFLSPDSKDIEEVRKWKAQSNYNFLSGDVCIKDSESGLYIIGMPIENPPDRNKHNFLVLSADKNLNNAGISWRFESQDDGQTFQIKNVRHKGYWRRILILSPFRIEQSIDSGYSKSDWKIKFDPDKLRLDMSTVGLYGYNNNFVNISGSQVILMTNFSVKEATKWVTEKC